MFKRLSVHLEHKPVIITTEPMVKLSCLFSGHLCELVRNNATDKGGEDKIDCLESSIDYLNGKVDFDDLNKIASSVIISFNKILNENKIDTVLIWNGQQVLGRIATFLATKYKLKTLYLEISNLPNKLFADHKGVNALSSLMESPELEAFNDESIHSEWVKDYIQSKRKPLPQAQKSNKEKLIKAINVLLKKAFSGFKVKLSNYNKTLDFSELSVLFTNLENINDSFVFFPLQVTSDTQIKLHSDYDNVDALMYAIDYSFKCQKKLVVKVHPAETSQDFIDLLVNLCDEYDFIISNDNTVDLITHSETVITINSTVGLEAKIFGKEVIVLGRAFYAKFNDSDLKSYIHNFLVDGIDYFSNKPISKDKVQELIRKAK
ncbi:hypothetical protein GCM10008027_26470 [Pseudoalteromonas gelatinilytica]|uniref:Capsular biosynthesis protein n=1 Tax=Pseudoalteromonas gelatinilytica TaxID=1703256 RepID=A0ABQ1TQY1_9GAMM|nr:hypothetical protein GCM10008027_26470 [Pseudoalteromonas profundi]